MLSHAELGEEEFVRWVPGSEGANNEGKDLAYFTGGLVVISQRFVFEDFGLGSFIEGIRTIVEGTRNVNDEDAVVLFYNDVWAER